MTESWKTTTVGYLDCWTLFRRSNKTAVSEQDTIKKKTEITAKEVSVSLDMWTMQYDGPPAPSSTCTILGGSTIQERAGYFIKIYTLEVWNSSGKRLRQWPLTDRSGVRVWPNNCRCENPEMIRKSMQLLADTLLDIISANKSKCSWRHDWHKLTKTMTD